MRIPEELLPELVDVIAKSNQTVLAQRNISDANGELSTAMAMLAVGGVKDFIEQRVDDGDVIRCPRCGDEHDKPQDSHWCSSCEATLGIARRTQ